LVASVPDWPVVAAGFSPEDPAVVVAANRVVAATAAARADGVRPGLRRREAQGRSPGLTVVAADTGRDARVWEPLVGKVEKLTSSIEVLAPGAVALATRGPSRYFGGDLALGQKVADLVDRALGQPGCRVGVADGLFAARLAATRMGDDGRPVVVVGPGDSRTWLSGYSVSALGAGYEELADLLIRLGVRTLGDLAALPAPAVLSRFGTPGATAHRLARGLDDHILHARTPPPDLVVSAELDPPELRVEAITFVAKALADDLQDRLKSGGLAATKVAIEIETEHGERQVRHWRHEGALTAVALSERARWQLEGWMLDDRSPTGGVTLLRLVPEEVRPDQGRQPGFWGGLADTDARAARALARLQGLLGPDAVLTASLSGGRGFAEQITLVPWGDSPAAAPSGVEIPPWPGRLAQPSPAVVHQPPRPAELNDSSGQPVQVTGRGLISEPPATVSLDSGRWQKVQGWAGPWPLEERWWDAGGRRRARFQVLLDDGRAHVVSLESGRWWLEASYD
jgi:protein ImuB